MARRDDLGSALVVSFAMKPLVAHGVLRPSKPAPARADTSPSLGAREPENAAWRALRFARRRPFFVANSVHHAARHPLARRSAGSRRAPCAPRPCSFPNPDSTTMFIRLLLTPQTFDR